MKLSTLVAIAASLVSYANGFEIKDFFENGAQEQKQPSLEELWGADLQISGIHTFAHLPFEKCLVEPGLDYDIAILGVPFDTATSYRPGARFGPAGLRTASRRMNAKYGTFDYRNDIDPFDSWAKIIDCGDIPVTPMDNVVALKQMTLGYEQLFKHPSTKASIKVPRIISLGGDHSITLAALRALHKEHGKITLLHFDSHIDTWIPKKTQGYWDSNTEFTHGSMLWMAHEEGLLSDDSNMHIGIRTKIKSLEDYKDDDAQGYERIFADEIFSLGVEGISQRILNRVDPDSPVYISIDIDVLDPAYAPGTGTPEIGGLLSREMLYILRKLEGLNLVGGDLVEVAPAYDNNEVTALAGANFVYQLMSNMVKRELSNKSVEEKEFQHLNDRFINVQ